MLRSGFETLETDYGDMARRWEGSGKALKAHGGFRVLVDRASQRF